MVRKYVIELDDDLKDFKNDVDYLQMAYGAEEVVETKVETDYIKYKKDLLKTFLDHQNSSLLENTRMQI